MCGIAGIASQPGTKLDLGGILASMQRALHHRGPDDRGLFVAHDEIHGLANCRLAIRDLRPEAHMPMANERGDLVITYNGELYNADTLRARLEPDFHFHTSSDTEVVLRGYEAWGPEVLGRVRGMFAFGLLDLRGPTPRLLLARDRLGIKPLYLASTPQGLLFASEVKALTASGLVPRSLRREAVAAFLATGSVPGPMTIWQGVDSFPPAHYLVHQDGRTWMERYWSFPNADSAGPSGPAAVAQTRRLLEDAVRSHLVSDVPVGAFLSGGLDSAAVVALARRHSDGPILTCSIAFGEAEYDEGGHARAVAEALACDHHEQLLTGSDVRKALPDIVRAMDQPSVDGANSWFVSRLASRSGLKVALSGLGGDELFGGYRQTFRDLPRLVRVVRVAGAVPWGLVLARGAARAAGSRGMRLQDVLDGEVSPERAYEALRGLFSPREVAALVPGARALRPAVDVASPSISGWAHWSSIIELSRYTRDQLLRDTDAMSMAHSLEVRVPLLDDALVEGVLRLPPGARKGHAKALLRRAVAPDLPTAAAVPRPKKGFELPFARWLLGDLRDAVEEALGSDALAAAGVSRSEAAETWTRFKSGRLHWSRPWALASLAWFMEQASPGGA